MKKLLFTSLFAASTLLTAGISHAQMMPINSDLQFQNITTTAATAVITIGNDGFGSFAQNRQSLKLEYRAMTSADSATPVQNGNEIQIPLNYPIDSNTPNPVKLTGLVPRQKYVVWLGHQAFRSCVTDTPCTAIYTNFDTGPYTFTTATDTSTIPVLTKQLTYLTKSNDVTLLQKYLVANNFMKTKTGTTFDLPTLVGVIRFQIANNMNTDGVVGSGSRAIINQWLLQQ